MDANEFILSYNGFDYIDIDPFGSPNPFLTSAIIRIARDGILAVTATDTSALSGTYTNACKRKYWAKPLRNELMHEVGLRILIRKVQMIGANFDKALIPLLSYSKDHYMRIFFRCEKGKKKADEIMKQHKFLLYHDSMDVEISNFPLKEKGLQYSGPLWTGKLNDKRLLKKIMKGVDETYEDYAFLKTLSEEIEEIGFYDIHILSKKYKLTPRINDLIENLKKKKFSVSRTHLTPKGIKTNAKIKEILKIINNPTH